MPKAAQPRPLAGLPSSKPSQENSAQAAPSRAVAHVEIGFDGDEHQFAAVLAAERDVRGSEQVDLVPLVHLGDPPTPGEGTGDARRTPDHVVAPISLGTRTRL